MINVIFLDIDGVIVVDAEDEEFCEVALENLKSLVEQTNAYIVISSSWRFHKPGTSKHTKLMDILQRYNLYQCLIGHTGSDPIRTHDFQSKNFGQGQGEVRGKNIFLWLMDNWERYDIRGFVILDDLKNMGIMDNYLANCNSVVGLTIEVRDKALRILSLPIDKNSLLKSL